MSIRVTHATVLGGFILTAAVSLMAQTKTPRPPLVVLCKGPSELEIVDTGKLVIDGRIKTGPFPHEVAMSSDGNLAVVTNYGKGMKGTTLSIIDLDKQTEHRFDLTNLVGPNGEKFGDLIGPHGVEFFHGKFYFTAEGSKKIARYDPKTNKVDWVHEIGQERTHMLVISKEGHAIYTSNVNSGTVTAVEENRDGGDWKNTLIPVGKGPEGIDISPDGKEVWAANSNDGTVSIIDTGAKKVIETIPVQTKHSNRLKFTTDGKRVLISDLATGELIVLDAKSRKVDKRIKLGSSAEGILIVPDGKTVYVAVSGDDKVAQLDVQRLEVTGTIQTGKDPDGMAQ